MIKTDPVRLLSEFVYVKDSINILVENISNRNIVAFGPITLEKPELEIPIHGFYTSISYLYIVYFESGKTTIRFLSERASALGLDSSGYLKSNMNLVHAFRTYLQHNLNLCNRDDLAKRQNCEDWIQNRLKIAGLEMDAPWPQTSQQWETLLFVLFEEALQLMKILYDTVNAIYKDESFEEVIELWIFRIKRQYTSFEWDRIVTEAASDMGLETLDIAALRGRYLEKWNQKLSILKDDYNFSIEARRLVEQTFLNEEKLPLPITGKDIMDEFSIPSGPRVGELLSLAQKIFFETPCNRNELISAIRDEIVI